jgi:regulatory protein
VSGQDERALAIALQALARADRLEGGLRRMLLARGLPESAVEASLDRLRSWGLVDDARASQRLVSLKVDQGGMGRLGIMAALVRRGLPEEEASKAVSLLDPADEAERAAALLQRRRNLAGQPARAARYLASRGFEECAAREAIQRVFGDLED